MFESKKELRERIDLLQYENDLLLDRIEVIEKKLEIKYEDRTFLPLIGNRYKFLRNKFRGFTKEFTRNFNIMAHTKEFIEPNLIKAGANNLGLGFSNTPPKVDCRVIAEEGYQRLKKAYDSHDELLEALERIANYTPFQLQDDYPALFKVIGDSLKAVNNAKS